MERAACSVQNRELIIVVIGSTLVVIGTLVIGSTIISGIFANIVAFAKPVAPLRLLFFSSDGGNGLIWWDLNPPPS